MQFKIDEAEEKPISSEIQEKIRRGGQKYSPEIKAFIKVITNSKILNSINMEEKINYKSI